MLLPCSSPAHIPLFIKKKSGMLRGLIAWRVQRHAQDVALENYSEIGKAFQYYKVFFQLFINNSADLKSIFQFIGFRFLLMSRSPTP